MSVGAAHEAVEYGKKRKKRSFIQVQKRHAKKGFFGRGTQLTQDMYDYFLNIMKVMNTKKEDEEEMCVLAANILSEIEGKESEYCCNQIISRVIENLLPYSNDEDFSQFIKKFSENLRPLFCDPFGSHVLQQTIVVAYIKYSKCSADKETDNKLQIQFFNYILKISNFLLNNIDDFIWDTYSNSIGKTVFNVLSGNPVKREVKPIESDEKVEENNVPDEFTSLLEKFAKKILSFPNFNELCHQEINSSFLQSLLIALTNKAQCSAMIDRIVQVYESSPIDLKDVNNSAFVRLLEVVLCLSDKATIKRIYKIGVKENLVELAKSKYGNFIVQKIIRNCKSKKLFGKIFAQLESEMEGILETKNTGVLLAIVKACQALEICQGGCMTMLNKAFHMKETKEIVPLVSTLLKSEEYDPKTAVTTLNGCLIVQELFNFKKPINIVNSLLEMSESNLVKLLCDTKGCHITDAFLNSQYVGEKNKDRLFKKLQGHFLDLATSKHGSRSLDSIWDSTSVTQKATLAEELKERQSDLCGTVYGKNFAWKIHLDNYRRNKEDWIKVYKSSETAEKYFADILPKKKQKTS